MTETELSELRRIQAMLATTNRTTGELHVRRMAYVEERLALLIENAEEEQ